jgi:hypothetical protein
MKRVLFGLWLVVAAVVLFAVSQWIHPPVGNLGSPSSLLVIAIWLVGIVPISFTFWFRVQHRREQEVVQTALRSWREQTPNAGVLVAEAIELALADEDEDALKLLLEVLATAPAKLDPALKPFMKAAKEWITDDGGHSSRDEHLQAAREAARPLLPLLQSPPL